MLRKFVVITVVTVAGVIAFTSGVAGAAKGGTPGRNSNHGSTVSGVARNNPRDGTHGSTVSTAAKDNKGHATTTTTAAP